MLSLKTLLNPAPSGLETPRSLRSSPALSSPAFSTVTEVSTSAMDRPTMPKLRLPKESNHLTKSKLRGPIQYPPFEDLDEASLLEIQRFQVAPFGNIHQSSLHIPYNSGKKDFFEKTGRESFEVFRYEFTAPGHHTEYAVMWDYNVGLVRMTPFFKCCQYGKTMPAKMLGLNPGLKEITHSITGGAIAAQGYWMPYSCARAVCATFCYHIAGALIPIFGPTFPSDCVRPDSPDFGRMVINPRLVVEATREAEIVRRVHLNSAASSFNGATSHPRRDRTPVRSPHTSEDRKFSFRPRLVCDPTWPSDSDNENYYSAPNSASSNGSGLHGYMISSRPSSGWTSTSQPTSHYDNYPRANPWLSAVPRPAQLQPQNTFPASSWAIKRRLDYDDSECSREGSSSPNISMSPAVLSDGLDMSPVGSKRKAEEQNPDLAQKNAALLLLNLSMKEQLLPPSARTSSPPIGSLGLASPASSAGDCHRRKRQRALSV